MELTENGVRARLEPVAGGKAQSVSGSHLLVAVGRRPVTEGLGLEATEGRGGSWLREGRRLRPHWRALDLRHRRHRGWHPQLAHAATAEGVVAVEHIAGLNPEPVRYTHVPGCTYSSPEIGSVGLTEEKARAQGIDVVVGKFPFTAIGKAKVMGDTNGFLKLVAEKQYGQILGVHIIGPRATDLIAEGVPLVKLEYTLEELTRTVHAHPTLAEVFHEAAHAALGHALHM
ncbi:MAG: hypothetical protein R3F60_31455 [bacterium]